MQTLTTKHNQNHTNTHPHTKTHINADFSKYIHKYILIKTQTDMSSKTNTHVSIHAP